MNKSNKLSLLERAKRVISPVLGHYSDLEVQYGHGCYLVDFQNREYLDFACGIAVTSTGHCHPDVVAGIQAQAGKLLHASIGIAYYEPYVALAEKLGALLGDPLTSVFFCQSGSEAIEAAIKLAKYTSHKHGLVAFKGGFHGRTLGSLSITTSKMKYRDGYEPLLPYVDLTPYPYCFRCPYGKTQASCELHCLSAFESQIASKSDSIAAVVIEPVLGEGGYVPAPPGFLAGLKTICQKHNILLIFDEIQTGFGRTGEWFCFQKEGVIPDIIVLAKGIASGMPLGACVASPELMSKWTTGAHGSTYGGNPVSCAAGLATLQVLESYVPQITELSKKGSAFLRTALADSSVVGDIRVSGLMFGIEFVKDRESNIPNPEFIKPLIKTCLDRQLITIACGVHDNVIRLIPPLIISETELIKGLQLFTEAIYELAAH